MAVLSATAAVFPVLGGILVTVAWNVPFLAYFAAVPVALGAVVVLDDPPRLERTRETGYLRDALHTIATPPTLALFGATFLTEFLAFGVVFTALPFLLAPVATPVVIGLVLLTAEAVSTVSAAATGRLARHLTPARLIAVGFAAYAVGFAGTWLASDPPLVAVAAAFVGAGFGILLPSVDAAVSERVPATHRAGALSLRNSTTFLGRASGPVVFVGLAVTAGFGYQSLLLAAGVVSVGAAAVTAVLAGR